MHLLHQILCSHCWGFFQHAGMANNDLPAYFEETHLFVITKPFIITQARTFLDMFALAMASPDMLL